VNIGRYELNNIYNEDCLEAMKQIPKNSIDIILTDPPYLYLKNQKLDIPFDEDAVFNEFYRILKPNGFVILFGRGTSFYRWNTKISEIGFKFLEEIIWDKRNSSGAFLNLSRVHETISIHTKGNGKIIKSIVPYLEKKQYNLDGIIADVKRLSSYAKNEKNLDELKKFIITKQIEFTQNKKTKFEITGKTIKCGNQGIYTAKSIITGMVESSIISVLKESYNFIHPTQKPIKLLERLLKIIIEKYKTAIVLDPFAGSGSTVCACINLGLKYMAFELDKDYFESANKRINDFKAQGNLFDIINTQPKIEQENIFTSKIGEQNE